MFCDSLTFGEHASKAALNVVEKWAVKSHEGLSGAMVADCVIKEERRRLFILFGGEKGVSFVDVKDGFSLGKMSDLERRRFIFRTIQNPVNDSKFIQLGAPTGYCVEDDLTSLVCNVFFVRISGRDVFGFSVGDYLKVFFVNNDSLEEMTAKICRDPETEENIFDFRDDDIFKVSESQSVNNLFLLKFKKAFF